jgi:uncharacterized phage protein gp47/JayE
MATLLNELSPNADTRSGPLHDYLVKPHGTLAAYRRTELEEMRYGLSLLLAQANPDIVSAEQVDLILGNYLLTRLPGVASTGSVVIVVTRPITVSVPAGGTFVANGRTFKAVSPFIGLPPGEVALGQFERVMTQRTDGFYSFTVEVECTENGPAGQLPKDALLVPSFPIMALLKAYAASDFSSGAATESNEQLLSRQVSGIAAKAASGRFNCTAAILNDEAFERLLAISIIGYGDAEMRRDTRALLPVQMGGRSDWYVRLTRLPTRTTAVHEASLVEKTADGFGIWQVVFTRDSYPGFYDVPKIIRKSDEGAQGTYAITSLEHGLDDSYIENELTPDLPSTIDGTFTRYQTGVLRFKDTDTATASLTVNSSKRDYLITVRHVPDIVTLQTAVGSRRFAYPGGDILIKAPVPCFVSVAFKVQGRPRADLPDEAALKAAVADYVNTTGFPGRLFAAKILEVIGNFLGSSVYVQYVDMRGEILSPDGRVVHLHSTQVLEIPDDYENMMTGRTVVFYLDPEDVVVSGLTQSQPVLL